MSLEYYLKLKGISRPNLCDVFNAVAEDTWERIKFSRSNVGMKVHETALTQNLIYEMRLLKNDYKTLPYVIYESRHEKANGNDLLLRVQHKSGKVYTYAIQSKIIYHDKPKFQLRDGYYQQLKHMVGKDILTQEPQVNKLLRYSKNRGFVPLYMFYNYVSYSYKGLVDPRHGCIISNSFRIKDNFTDALDGDLRNNVFFSDLHIKYAFPWEDLVCSLTKLTTDELLAELGLPSNYPIREGDYDDLNMDENYVDTLLDDKELKFINPKAITAKGVSGDLDLASPDFNPKFAIMAQSQGEKEFY